MTISRVAIFDKLWALVQGVPGVVTFDRTLKLWDDVDPSAQPAIFLMTAHQTPTQSRGLPTKWALQADLIVYAHAKSSQEANPGARIQAILDALEHALEPLTPLGPEGFVQTFAGGVLHCWITGIDVDEGPLDGQAVAIVHLELSAV